MTRCIKIKNLQAVTGKAERQAITVYYNKKLGGTPIKIPATTTFRCSTADIYQKVIYLIHNQNSKVRRGGGGDRKPEYRSDASKWAIFRAPFPAPPAPVEVSMERVGAWNDGTSGTSAEIETGSQNHKNSVGHAIDND